MSKDSICTFIYALASCHEADAKDHGNLIVGHSLRDVEQVSYDTDSRGYSLSPMSILF